MNHLTRRNDDITPQVKELPSDMIRLISWSIYLFGKAMYKLGKFALQRGGAVELQFGPFTYRAYGNKEERENRKIIDL